MHPFELIRQKPRHFLVGFVVAVVGAAIGHAALYDTHPDLWIGLQAGWQGAVYLFTCERAQRSTAASTA